MSDFNISEFIKIMQTGLAEDNTQEATGRLLLESVAQQDGVIVDISGKMISNLVKQKSDVHDAIKTASTRQKVIAEAQGYFKSKVVPKLNPHTNDDVFNKLIALLNSDPTVAIEKKDSLTQLHKEEKLGEFLALLFLYAINRPNKLIGSSNGNLPNAITQDNEDFIQVRKTNKNKNSNSMAKRHTPAKEFVNREKPRQIFYDLINSSRPLDANVIMYHGIGGIGKSSLLTNLKGYLAEHGVEYSAIDFADSALCSSYSALLEIEKTFKITFPHFALAASIYFFKRNPDFFHRDVGLPNGIAKLMSSFIKDSCNRTSDFSGVIDYFYNKYELDWLLDSDEKEELKRLEKMSPTDIEKHLAYFFALDLREHLEAESFEKYVVFFDTYEMLWPNGQNDSNKLSTDDWVRQLTSYLNNVIFVISGREELLWKLDKKFPQEKLIQVPLEMLSEKYARKFLESCQITNAEFQDAIISSSQGYPYYLDLCADTYHKHASVNKSISIELFNGGFQEIQARFFKSLTEAERESLKVLCIPRFYDLGIFRYLTTKFNTGYPVTSIDNFNAFSFVESKDNGKNIIHALMRNEISEQLSDDLKNDIHKSMISFYDKKLSKETLTIDSLRYYFTELVFHLKNSYKSTDIISFVENKYLPLVKKFQFSGDTKYLLEIFEELFSQNKTDVAGTEFFAIMVDMIHLSGRYHDAVGLINGYLNKFSIKEIASDGYRLNLFIRKIHHQMFFVSAYKLQCEVKEILSLIDGGAFPQQYCEILFMMGAHILLPAGDHDSACIYLKDVMRLSAKNHDWGLLCRGLRKYAELLCAQKEFSLAEKTCLAGLSIAQEHGLTRYELYLQCVLGEIKRLTGQTEEALIIFNKAKPISIAMGITGWIAHVEISIGNCLVDAKNFDAGLNSYREAKNLYCSINQVWGRLNSEIAIFRAGLFKGEKIEETAFLELKQETQQFGYKILTQQIEDIFSGNLEKIQFEYL